MSRSRRPGRFIATSRVFSVFHSYRQTVQQLLALITAALFLFQPTLLAARGPSFEIKKPTFAANSSRSGSNVFVEAPAPFVSTTLVINEIDYDQVGGDTAEFVELKNVSAGAINLDNYTVELINAGATGGPAAYDTVNLPNVNLAAGDYYVICANAATVVNCDFDDDTNTDFIQNGNPDAVALRLSGTIVDTVSYEGNTTGFTETTGTPNTATGADSNTVANLGLSRFADGSDTDNNSADLTIRCITPGTTNSSATTGCTAPVAIPNLTINDVSANETNAGTTTFSFTVNLSAPAGPGGVTFDIATADGTAQDDNPATEDSDYVAKSLTAQTIPAGSSSYTFDVTVNGDAVVEPTENFFVNVTNITGAAGVDPQGQGTIQNDDSPNLTINDVSQDEGSGGGTTAFTFTVSLNTTIHGGVTFDIASADGTAQDGNPGGEDTDYTANSLLSQSIPNGSDSYQFTVNVNADSTVEPNETFFVNVTNVTGATVADGQGLGTIVNDDFVITPIHTIQGSGATTPIPGANVTTTGIVTLLKTGSNAGAGAASGFFLQTPDAAADADPNTSQGIFVFTNSVPTVAVGDEVRLTGTVVEFNGLTEITSVTQVSVIDTGNTLPTAVTLDTTILSPTAAHTQPQLEKYEGMRLASASLKSTAPNDNFFDVYAVLSTVPRPVREPGVPSGDPIPPDPTSMAVDCCIPIFDRNPERLKLDTNGRAGALNNFYTSNVTFTNVSGPLDYSFGEYRLVSDAALTASANMSAVPVPTPLATEFTVAGFNIENFNNATAAGMTQRQKAALAIVRVMRLPDIIGHSEIFDLASLQALATEVNTLAVADGHPNPMYEARLILTPVAGIDQNVGFLVKTSRVQIDAVTQERTASTYTRPSDGAPDETHDRPPLVLRATVEPTGANKPVIVVVNHTRSFIDIELSTGTGQNVRAKRKAQAEDLAGLFQELQINNPGVPVIGVGDYNAFQFNNGYDDPIAVIKGNPTPDDQIVVDASPDLVNPNFFNLIDKLPVEERYTFIFNDDKQAQVLDHVLVNTVANGINTRIFVARNNADFPTTPSTAFASDATRPERNSDHDMPVAYFTLSDPQPAGSVIISEFRFRGPGGISGPPLPLSQKIAKSGITTPVLIGPTNQAEDEFVEIYNNSDSNITVSTTDGSAGWALVAADGVTRFIIPNGTLIPARGHFLGVNTVGYSLANYGGSGAAAGNSILLADGVTPASGYTQDIPDGSGIALFRSANSANFTLAERLDAAGYTGVPELYREGAGFPTGGAETTGGLEYTFFRSMTRATGGLPKDTGNNLVDFLLADTAGTDFDPGAGTTQRLGAPGPENLSSPINRTAQFGYSLLDTAVSAEVAPNRVRDTMFSNPSDSQFGTLTLRRTFTNNTGETLSRLRFRIVEITTFPSPVGSGLADLRALSSNDEPVTLTNNLVVVVRGTTLEQPPTQSIGGGWNATLNVPIGSSPALDAKLLRDTPTTGTILLSAPLNNGESINVQFKLGVMKTGAFFFYLNIEASPGCPPLAALPCSVF